MKKADFFANVGGLNITDSPFYVKDNQATGGMNYDYANTGGITKRRGLDRLNTSADAQLRSLGLNLHNTSVDVKTVVRAAGTKFQSVVLDPFVATDQNEDTLAVNSNFFIAGSTQPVEMVNYLTADSSVVWAAGGGASSMYGYTGTNITKNGTPAPTGTFTITNLGNGTGGAWATTGTYFYALVLRKRSTKARSLAALDDDVTITDVSQGVELTFPAVDATKYDQWLIYRSAVSGVTGFTTGDLVATVDTADADYIDTGSSTANAQNVPRAGGVVDNSELPAGTIKYITIFKRRLVTAIGSTFYLSDVNKPESWPSANFITIPTGGSITGFGVVGSNAPLSSSTDEYLVIFKEKEMWMLTGTSVADWELKFVANVGCANQSLIVAGNGYLAWIDYRGIYLWNGSSKPIYTSRPIEAIFAQDGDLDKTKLYYGWGEFSNKQNNIVWVLSHKVYGENTFSIKLDLRLTLPETQESIEQSVMDGFFAFDTYDIPLYSGFTYLPSSVEENFLVGDASGYVYKAFRLAQDVTEGIEFSYITKFLDMGMPGQAKRFFKVIAWVDELGPWDLTLDYWSNYRLRDADRSTIDASMDSNSSVAAALWDLAIWDRSEWDDYVPRRKALIFNLSSAQNNNEGDCLLLRFKQIEANSPVTIYGFSVLYEELPIRK